MKTSFISAIFLTLFIQACRPYNPDKVNFDKQNDGNSTGVPGVAGVSPSSPSPGPLAPAPVGPSPVAQNPMTPNPQNKPTTPSPMPQTPAPAPAATPAPVIEFEGAHIAIGPMRTYYNYDSGLWNDGTSSDNWWKAANSLTAMIDYMTISGSREYLDIIDNTYKKGYARYPGFVNEFFDDNGWWGLAWLRAYDITGDTKYLTAAKFIADQMWNEGLVSNKCGGGGIRWKKNEGDQLNSIENELYIKLAAGLYNRDKGKYGDYLNKSKKVWEWFSKSGLINDRNLVNDGLDMNTCRNPNNAAWSYNQGVILGALNELFKATNDNGYKEQALKMALASSQDLGSERNGIILEKATDYCKMQNQCTGDERMFKGAYVRNLRELNETLNNAQLKNFLENNAKTAWSKARNDEDRIGFFWEGGFDRADSVRQTSGLDLMNAAILKTSSLKALRLVGTTGSTCSANEDGAKALDNQSRTKWCAGVPGEGAQLELDLGSSTDIKSIRILHAGAGGEDAKYNTKDFKISVADTREGAWTDVASVSNNRSSVTFHNVNKKARYLRVRISNGGEGNVARIYEVYVK